MKLLASGWRRHISTRMLFDRKLADAALDDKYDWNKLTLYKVSSADQIRIWHDLGVADEGVPALAYRFRLHVGESTMGGDYSADLLVGADDVLAMFKQMFGHLTLEELLRLVGERHISKE